MSGRETPETPLETLNLLSALALKRLNAVWITTGEELVAQAASPDTRKRLASLLDLSAEAFDELLAKIQSAPSPDQVKGLEEKPPDDKGLGALKPPA